MLRGDADASMLDRYTQFTQEQVRQEYLRAIPKLGVQEYKLTPVSDLFPHEFS